MCNKEVIGDKNLMSKYKKKLIGVLVFIGIIVFIIALIFINKDFQEFVLSSISEEETTYAKGYSDKAWDEVKINDTFEKVLKLLGEPLKIYKANDGSFSYHYTYQGPRDTNYRIRAIFFNKEGRVIEKLKEFYVD